MALINQKMYFRNELTGHAWSEKVYFTNATTLDKAKEKGDPLAVARANLLGAGVRVVRITYSDDLIQRDALGGAIPLFSQQNPICYNKDFIVTLGVKGGQPGHDETDYADFPQTCLLLRKRAGTLYAGSMFLAGAPDVDQSIVDNQPQDPIFIKYYDPWKKLMLSGDYGMKVQSRENDNPAKPIIGIAGAANGLVNVAGHGYQNLSKVRITGVKAEAKPNQNGTWTIVVPDADHFALRGFNNPDAVYVDGGQVRQVKPIVQAFTALEIVGFGSHKRGNGTFRLHGKARKR